MTKDDGKNSIDKTIVFVNNSCSQRVDLFLLGRLPGKTRAFIQKLVRNGFVSISGAGISKSSNKIKPGEKVEILLPPPEPSELEPKYVPFSIVYEDKDLVVINKPAGVMVHPVNGGKETTLVHGLLHRIQDLSQMAGNDRPGIVHRLDRDTTGLMLVAKNDITHHKLSLMFKAREMHKAYIAVCHVREHIQGGLIDLPIGRSLRDRKKMSIRYDAGRSAITEFRVGEQFGSYAVVNAYPRSGRTHQIRVHLSFMGLPILCDKYYGETKKIYLSTLKGERLLQNEKPIMSRQALHARSLEFVHPGTGLKLRFEAAIPSDMFRLIGILRRTFSSSGTD